MADHGAGGIEGFCRSGGLHHHVGSSSSGQCLHLCHRVLFSGIDDHISSQGFCQIQLSIQHIHHDHLVSALQPGTLGNDLSRVAASHDHHRIAQLDAGMKSGEHGAGRGLTQGSDIHIQSLGNRLELEAFCLKIIRKVIIPSKGHDLVSHLVVTDAASYGCHRPATLMAQKKRKLRRLAELRRLGRKEASVKALIRSADPHHMVLYDNIVLSAFQFPLDQLDIIGFIEPGCSCDKFFHFCFLSAVSPGLRPFGSRRGPAAAAASLRALSPAHQIT